MSKKSTPPDSKITAITSEKTDHLKGIALILLMWHHLFGVNYLDSWLSPIEGIDMVIGISAKVCLGIFLFCSGYGLYKSYINKDSAPKTYILQRAVKTLIPYWIIMLIAIVILAILGKFEPKYIPVNLFAWLHNDDMLYVSFAWYIKLYLCILLLLPLVRLIDRKLKRNALIDIALYILVPFAIWFFLKGYQDEEHFVNVLHSLVSTILFTLMWFPLFAAGMIFAKYEVYGKVRKVADRFPGWLVIIVSLLVCGYVIYLRFLFYHECIADVIYAPLFVVACLLIMDNLKFRSKYVIPYLGKKSIYYWLLSSMFFINTTELLPAITWPRIPLLILVWTLLLLTPFVYACDFISGKLVKLIIRKK